MSEYSSPGENAFVANGAQALAQDEKPRLTEEEKKKNHIASGAPFLKTLPRTVKCSANRRDNQSKSDDKQSVKVSINLPK
jgi:hypothetical protein